MRLVRAVSGSAGGVEDEVAAGAECGDVLEAEGLEAGGELVAGGAAAADVDCTEEGDVGGARAGSYSRPRGAAVGRGCVEVELIARRKEADVRLAPAGDEEFLARRRTLHVPAEAIAEVVGAESVAEEELSQESGAGGTRTHGLLGVPLRRSAQLSYSPGKLVIGGPV